MSGVGILVMLWSLALGGNTISLGEKCSLKQLSVYLYTAMDIAEYHWSKMLSLSGKC